MKTLIYLSFFGLLLFSIVIGLSNYQKTVSNHFAATLSQLETSIVASIIKKVPKALKEKTPCEKTLYYSFGELDARHDINPEKLSLIMQKAESVWEGAMGYNLFEYKEGVEFKINFVFDERQEQTNLSKLLDDKLDTLKYSQKNISKDYTMLVNEHTSLLKKYQKDLSTLKKGLKKYNARVEEWNKKGGAPKKEFEKLNDEKEDLADLQEKLGKRQRKLNKLVKKINTLADKEQSLIDEYNAEVTTYQSKFGSTQEFNQGDYFGDGINIYQFRDDSDLILALTHELGHALSVGHVENSASIMYYLMGAQDLNNPKLTTEDIFALKNICHLEN